VRYGASLSQPDVERAGRKGYLEATSDEEFTRANLPDNLPISIDGYLIELKRDT